MISQPLSRIFFSFYFKIVLKTKLSFNCGCWSLDSKYTNEWEDTHCHAQNTFTENINIAVSPFMVEVSLIIFLAQRRKHLTTESWIHRHFARHLIIYRVFSCGHSFNKCGQTSEAWGNMDGPTRNCAHQSPTAAHVYLLMAAVFGGSNVSVCDSVGASANTEGTGTFPTQNVRDSRDRF